MPLAGSAAAFTAPKVDTSALDAALEALPGITSTQLQALDSDLATLAAGGSPSALAGDLDGVVGTLASDSGIPTLVDSLRNLLNDTPTSGDIAKAISQLADVANQTGVPSTVSRAADALVSALTTADLPGLLGQAGSPLGPATIQTIVGELGALQGLAPGQATPAGLLSALAGALDTIASQPGVPAAAASTLDSAARALNSAGALTPGVLSSTIPALQHAIPSLDAVPVAGPTLGSLVRTVTTELAASPMNGAAGANGSAGANGANGGQGANASAQAPSASVQSAHINPGGARIRSLAYKRGHLYVTLACPALIKTGCATTINLHVGSWQMSVKKVTIRGGATRTVVVRLPHLATVAAKGRIALAVTATTGTFTTTRHTIRIRTHK